MQVIGYTESGMIRINMDGVEGLVPDDLGNRHRRMIAEWEAEGNAIPPFVAPKEDLLGYLADLRWKIEVGGTTWNGWEVHTDRESQGKILAERMAIMVGSRIDPDGWKFRDNQFRLLTNDEFIAMSNAVRDHVRNCFSLEAIVQAQIESGVIMTTAQIDEAMAS